MNQGFPYRNFKLKFTKRNQLLLHPITNHVKKQTLKMSMFIQQNKCNETKFIFC